MNKKDIYIYILSEKYTTILESKEDGGPAVERINGYKGWYINGIELTEEEFNAYLA